jgi:hypothetical protein
LSSRLAISLSTISLGPGFVSKSSNEIIRAGRLVPLDQCFGLLQSWIDPGAAAGGEDGRTGLIAGAGVAGAASDGAGKLDNALGGGSDFMAGKLDNALGGGSDFVEGVSTGPSSLCGGLSRGNGGLPGGG